MTVLSILQLFFIPLFQYCHDLQILGKSKFGTQDDVDRAKLIISVLLWLNFGVAILYGFELFTKIYAFGIRRAYASANWTIKFEFYY